MKKFNYYTQDGHLMKENEIMWRICDSKGNLFDKPVKCVFHHNTGYNHIYISNEEQWTNTSLNPYSANHLHYYSETKAIKQLKIRIE